MNKPSGDLHLQLPHFVKLANDVMLNILTMRTTILVTEIFQMIMPWDLDFRAL